MDETMDNQLARTLDRVWLAGFIDADGTITCANCPRKGKDRARPMIRIGNTNPQLIAECLRILDNEDINTYVYTQQPKKHHKIATIIVVGRMDMIQKLLEIIHPFLRGKQGQAELLLRLIYSRRKRSKDRYLPPYNQEELELMKEMGELNKKGIRDRMASA